MGLGERISQYSEPNAVTPYECERSLALLVTMQDLVVLLCPLFIQQCQQQSAEYPNSPFCFETPPTTVGLLRPRATGGLPPLR